MTLSWVPIDGATAQKMERRFEADIDRPAINWPETCEFEGEIPE